MTYIKDLLQRLYRGLGWIAALIVGSAAMIALGAAWTRIPEKHTWQVALSLLLPLLLLAGALALQTALARGLLRGKQSTQFAWGALSLLAWLAVGWLAWQILDWCDDNISLWAGYLNSKAPASLRGQWLTYAHLSRWMTILEWIFRWILVPGKLVPYAMATAQWGWTNCWGRALRVVLNWRWWPVAVAAALLSVLLPGTFFTTLPHGTPHEQIVRIVLKIAGTFLLAIVCWVLAHGWLAVLYGRQTEPAYDAWDQRLYRRLGAGKVWIAAALGWSIVWTLVRHKQGEVDGMLWLFVPLVLTLLLAVFVLLVLAVRAMFVSETKRTALAWGVLSALVWAILALACALGLSFWHSTIGQWLVGWIVVPALLAPFAAASAEWAFRLPWRRVAKLLLNWRWWLCAAWAAFAGVLLPYMVIEAFPAETTSSTPSASLLGKLLAALITMGAGLILLAWLAALLEIQQPPEPEGEVLVPVISISGPPKEPLPLKAEAKPPEV